MIRCTLQTYQDTGYSKMSKIQAVEMGKYIEEYLSNNNKQKNNKIKIDRQIDK